MKRLISLLALYLLLVMPVAAKNTIEAPNCSQSTIENITLRENIRLNFVVENSWAVAGLIRPNHLSNTALLKATFMVGTAVWQTCERSQLDRYGNPAGLIYHGDNQVLQIDFLHSGAALIAPMLPVDADASTFFTAESEARIAQIGLWESPSFFTTSAQLIDLAKANRNLVRGRFFIIRAKPVSIRKIGSILYMNYGDNFRDDLTLEISDRALRGFKKAWPDPEVLIGLKTEIRGYVDFKNGPRMILRDVRTLRVIP